jgi:hypothetical protein
MLTGLIAGSSAPAQAPAPQANLYKAGVASRVITPTEPLWMAGYAARNRPAEGKLQDLYVKALALEDASGQRVVLVTSDLVGIPLGLSDWVAEKVREKTNLGRDRLMLTCSHTHCGPVVQGSLMDMYDMSDDQAKAVTAYTNRLRGWMVETIMAAIADLKPARLAIGKSSAGFAVNRRQPSPTGITNGANPSGPVDRHVPVLRVATPEGRLRAVVFGYACHNTTLSFYRWCGDYAGFAQGQLEEKHPGALALFWTGCGGDANPFPRGTVELCQKHGQELADAVDLVLRGAMTPLAGALETRYSLVDLALGKMPTQESLKADLQSPYFAYRARAKRLLKALEAKGTILDHYPDYPVQVWKVGDDLVWVALGGEVVVDYSIRLKKALAGPRPVWVTAYANNVMSYIPSVRVLREGGYEADSSMVYYGMPTRWAPSIEEKIVSTVRQLVKSFDAEP